jgi:hypothetical protein
MGVTDRKGEETEPKGQQNDVKHGKLLAARAGCRYASACAVEAFAMINKFECALSRARASELELPLVAYEFEREAGAKL